MHSYEPDLVKSTYRNTAWILLSTYRRFFPPHPGKSKREVLSSASDIGHIHSRYPYDCTVHNCNCIDL